VEDVLTILDSILVQLLLQQNQLQSFLMMKAAAVDSIQVLKLETLEMETGASILAMVMVVIKDIILDSIATLLFLDMEIASMCVETSLTDVGIDMVEACSVEDADPIDLYVERVAVSDQRVEETIGNMATMETVLGVEMVEETWDITQDMGTILQSTIHHRMDLLE